MTLAEKRRRKALLSWVPITIVALVCAGFVVGAIAMQNSWWTQDDPTASDDQQMSDGTSRFDRAGVDFFTRQGTMRVKLREDAAPASALGLDADGRQDFAPITPVTAVIVAPDGAFAYELVDSFSLETEGDRVTEVRLLLDGAKTWAGVTSQLQAMAAEWGWTTAQLDQLTQDIGDKMRAGGETVVPLPSVTVKGATVSAEVAVDTDVSLTLVITDPAAG